MELQEKVGKLIRRLRKQQAIPQDQLAYKSEVDRSHMSDIELGRKNISIETLDKILNALDISFSDFFNDDIFKTIT